MKVFTAPDQLDTMQAYATDIRRVLIQASSELMDSQTAAEEKALTSLQIRYVTIIVATLPILAIYPFLQKYFVKGVMLGAVKG